MHTLLAAEEDWPLQKMWWPTLLCSIGRWSCWSFSAQPARWSTEKKLWVPVNYFQFYNLSTIGGILNNQKGNDLLGFFLFRPQMTLYDWKTQGVTTAFSSRWMEAPLGLEISIDLIITSRELHLCPLFIWVSVLEKLDRWFWWWWRWVTKTALPHIWLTASSWLRTVKLE